MAVPALPAAGCTKTLSIAGACSSAETSSAFSPRPPARHRFSALARHADHGGFHGALDAGGHVRAQLFGNRRRHRPGRAARRTAGRSRRAGSRSVLKKERSRRGPCIATGQNFQEQVAEARRRRPPRATALCARRRWRSKPSSSVTRPYRSPSESGIVLLLLERHLRAGARASASRSGNRRRGRASARWPLERRRIVCRRGVRQVMLQHHDAAVGELRAQLASGNRDSGIGRTTATASTCSGFAPARVQACGDGMLGQVGLRPPVRFWRRTSLDSSTAATSCAVLQNGAGGIAQMPPIPRMIIDLPPCLAFRSWPRCPAAPPCG